MCSLHLALIALRTAREPGPRASYFHFSFSLSQSLKCMRLSGYSAPFSAVEGTPSAINDRQSHRYGRRLW